MEKKFVFAVFYCFFQFLSLHLSASAVPANPEISAFGVDVCNAPAPDSFRITSYGYNFVTVAWHPAAPGDNHLLSVFRQNASNGWDTLYSVLKVNASTFTATNLDMSKNHKIQIRTVCTNGEPGNDVATVTPFGGTVLDLVLGARYPVNPQEVSNCTPVGITGDSWIGFRLTKALNNSASISNIFEFTLPIPSHARGKIRRNCVEHPLVAANWAERWPTSSSTLVLTDGLRFTVGEVSQENIAIFGYVYVELSNNNQVKLCAEDVSYPYTFQLLAAQSAIEYNNCSNIPSGGGGIGRSTMETGLATIIVQNPASEYLQVFFQEEGFESGLYNIALHDINGKQWIKEQIDVPEPQIALSLPNCPAGLYILRLEFKGQVQYLKVFIAE